jgi:hypothetical protein
VVLVVSLFAPAAVSNNRITQTNWASADDLCAGLGPVNLEVVLRSRKWDKENRVHVGSAPGVLTLPRSEPRAEPHSCQEVPL